MQELLYLTSLNPIHKRHHLRASNITVLAQGLISDVLPTGLLSRGAPSTSLNFTLNAVNNIVNAGAISSSGNLSLNAGGSITNALPSSASGTSP